MQNYATTEVADTPNFLLPAVRAPGSQPKTPPERSGQSFTTNNVECRREDSKWYAHAPFRYVTPLSNQNPPTNVIKCPFQADKLRTQQELERLQAKYIGTGHPDTTSWEWRTNIHRDTKASIVGHNPLLSYMSLAQNEPMAKMKAQLIRQMVQPIGPPPPREDEMIVIAPGTQGGGA